MTDPVDGDGEKLKRAQESYAEVLDATKHQDDKINRVLAGIAFLTTGAIAFLFRTDVVATRWTFGHHDVPFVALMAGGYFALTTASVILLLLSLSSELRLPGGKGPSPLADSYLYFTMIAGRTESRWLRDWMRPPATIDKQLLGQYQRETYNLAQRARLKYERTDEAAALFVLAMMFLAAGFLLALLAVARPDGAAVTFTWTSALLLASVFSGHAVLQLSALHRHEQQSVELVWRIRRHDARTRLKRLRRNGMRVLIAVVPFYVAGVLFTAVTADGARLLWTLIAVAASLAGYLATAPRWQPDGAPKVDLIPRYRAAVPYAVASAIALAAAVVAGTVDDPWPAVLAALAVPVLLSAITAGRQLTVARQVAAWADPHQPDEKIRSNIDDQLRPMPVSDAESVSETVGETGENGADSGIDEEAARMTAAGRATRSAEQVIAELLGRVPPARSIVYVSQPITTGPVYVGLRRSSALREAEIKAAAARANRDSSRALVARVRAAFPGTDVLDPSEYEEDGLEQHGYHALWQQVLEAYVRTVVFSDGWQYSVGCCIELETALDRGLEVLDAALSPLAPAAAADLVAAALPELSAAGIDVGPVRRALGRARSA